MPSAFPFKFCPACGSESIELRRGHEFRCPGCGFTYYHNVATAVGAIIRHADSILCLVRAKDPGRGKIGLPGGFVDPGESAEEALKRECLEEASLRVDGLRFLGSYPNDYEYKGVPYKTCDVFFTAEAAAGTPRGSDGFPMTSADPSEAASLRWTPISELDESDFAFPSMARAIRDWKAG